MVDWPGFEPGASGVQDPRSTADLPAHIIILALYADVNRQPLAKKVFTNVESIGAKRRRKLKY